MKTPKGRYVSTETPTLADDQRQLDEKRRQKRALHSPAAMLRSHEYLSEGEMESRMRELADDEGGRIPYAFGKDEETARAKPRPEVTLRTVRFSLLVLLSVGVIAGVTGIFWWGIRVDSVNEAVGSSDKSESKVDRYNTYSGVIMGVVETIIGLGLGNFFPVFTVYVHNLKWFPGDDPSVRVSKVKKIGVMVFFPLLMVAFGNSFTALQAGSSTQSSDLLLTPADLNASAASTTATNASSLVADFAASTVQTLHSPIDPLDETILRTAVQRRATPFTYPSFSACSKQMSTDGTSIMERLSVIDSTNLIVGFPIKEWGIEVYPEAPLSVSDDALDLQTSFELAFQGQAMMERAYGDVKPRYTCKTGSSSGSSGDTSLACWYNPSTYLPTLQEYVNGSLDQSASALTDAILEGIGYVFLYENGSTLNASTLSVQPQSFNLSSNIKVQALSISVEYNRDQYDWSEESEEPDLVPPGCQGDACDYRFNFTFSDTLCSADSCVFLDWNDGTRPIPRQQALMTRYMASCPPDSLAFSFDLGAEVPRNCEYLSDAAFVYGHGSRLVGDEFGTSYDGKTASPYALNPRRELFFTFARIEWEFEDLSVKFEATCINGTGDCYGLSHNLSSSSRYVLLGNDSVPARLGDSDFFHPIKLFELSSPQLKTDSTSSAVLYRVNASNFASFKTSRPLSGTECSVIAESYMKQIEANHYWMEDPMQSSLTAALLYFYQAGAVTSLFQENIPDSAFGKMAMSEDMILSTIYVSNTTVGAVALWVGCGIILLLAAAALLFPNERARLAPPLGSNMRAERFIGVQTEELYPNLVYKKRFLLGEEIKFREFAVESVTLHHKMEEEAHVRL